ncbi:MAG: anti-sigma factor antagonist [Coriobacteriia bacterium]|nr:anti-sigma factor antagonist [Coriobacteriia bacterium]
MAPFDVRLHNDTRVCVVGLSGDIDTAVVPELRADLASVLDGGCSDLVLDLTDVVYADSSALGLLVWLDHQLKPRGGRLVLAGANSDIARILELSGLIHVAVSITMSPDVSEAISGLELSEVTSEPLWTRELFVASDVNRLAEAREEVSGIVKTLGFPDSAIFDIKVALGEALANAVRHGKPIDGVPSVAVRILAYGDRVVLEVLDNGRGFDGAAQTPCDDLYASSGRGVMFMRALMDRVDFECPRDGGTLVRLEKHRQDGHSDGES